MNRRDLFKAAAGAAVVAAFPYNPPVKELVLDFTGPAMTGREALQKMFEAGRLSRSSGGFWVLPARTNLIGRNS